MRLVRLAGLSLLVIAASCSDAVAPRPETVNLAAAREQWRAQNLHTYAFTLQRSCFCGNVDPLYVAVVRDTVVGVLDLESGSWVDLKLGKTVEDLFTFVQNAIDGNAQQILVNYDGTRGFPTSIDYDGDAQKADDEIVYSISDVHPITPQT